MLYLIWRKPWMTVARDTYVSATLARAGCDTLPARATQRYPDRGRRRAAWRDAERILLSSEPYAFRARDAAALARALEQARATLIDGEWTSWYGARAIAGLRALRATRARRAPETKGRPMRRPFVDARELHRDAHADGDAVIVAVALAAGAGAGDEAGHAAEVGAGAET